DFAGGGQGIPLIDPSLAMNYIIRTSGDLDRIGEVIPFAGNFAPFGWSLAQGQVLPVSSNADLFGKVGSAYGGDGVETVALPDLRGRVAIGQGQGPGLTNRSLGEKVGVEVGGMIVDQMPSHDHMLPGGGQTTFTGGGQPFPILQPSLVMDYTVTTFGTFP